jgi:hypothetical protein
MAGGCRTIFLAPKHRILYVSMAGGMVEMQLKMERDRVVLGLVLGSVPRLRRCGHCREPGYCI